MRSRAAFTLEQINTKHKILRPGAHVQLACASLHAHAQRFTFDSSSLGIKIVQTRGRATHARDRVLVQRNTDLDLHVARTYTRPTSLLDYFCVPMHLTRAVYTCNVRMLHGVLRGQAWQSQTSAQRQGAAQ